MFLYFKINLVSSFFHQIYEFPFFRLVYTMERIVQIYLEVNRNEYLSFLMDLKSYYEKTDLVVALKRLQLSHLKHRYLSLITYIDEPTTLLMENFIILGKQNI